MKNKNTNSASLQKGISTNLSQDDKAILESTMYAINDAKASIAFAVHIQNLIKKEEITTKSFKKLPTVNKKPLGFNIVIKDKESLVGFGSINTSLVGNYTTGLIRETFGKLNKEKIPENLETIFNDFVILRNKCLHLRRDETTGKYFDKGMSESEKDNQNSNEAMLKKGKQVFLNMINLLNEIEKEIKDILKQTS